MSKFEFMAKEIPPKKVYMLSMGNYSDYKILGIYSTKQKALFIAKHFELENKYDGYDIDEIEIDSGMNHIKEKYIPYRINMNKNGTVTYTYKETHHYEIGNYINIEDKKMYSVIWAKDEQHAIKILNEKRVQFIANGEL